MHRFKLMGLTLLAVFAFGAFTAALASATPPLLLTLTEALKGLEYSGKSVTVVPTLETTGGKTITCVSAKATAAFTEATGKTSDSEKGTGTIDFLECKQGKVACRSENKAGEKDPVETILTPLTLLGGSEKTSAEVLQYILAAKITPADGSGILFLNCGAVKEEIKGDVPCLVTPALTEVLAGETVTLTCAQAKGVQSTGTCVENATTCKELKENPLLANLGTGVFEGSGEQLTISGTFNKMIRLED